MQRSRIDDCYSMADLFKLAQECEDAIRAGKAAEKLADEAYAAIADRKGVMSLDVVYEYMYNYSRHGAIIREDGTPVLIGAIGYSSEILAYLDGTTKMTPVISSNGIPAKESVEIEAVEPSESLESLESLDMEESLAASALWAISITKKT